MKEPDCTKLACGIISDLSSIHEEQMGDYLGDYVPLLYNLLSDSEVDREIKIPALHALGDLAMYCGSRFCE